MSNKISGNKLLLIVMLLIVPIMLSAAGNREAGMGQDVTLDENVMLLLEKIETGDITLEDAKAEFLQLGEEFQISEQEMNQVRNMMNDVAADKMNAEDCKDQLQEKLQTRERLQDQTQSKDQLKVSSSDGSGKSK